MTLKKSTFLVIAAGFIISFFVFQFKVKDEMVDFEKAFYRAGIRIRMSETLYRLKDEHYQFKYSPFSAFLFLPFSFLPLTSAKAIWFFLTIICSFLVIFLSYKLLHPKRRKSFLIMGLASLILAKFFLREWQLGQINALITLILLFMVMYSVSKEGTPSLIKSLYSGGFWGLATSLKPYALIFFPYFILTKKWNSLFSGFILLTITFFLPSLFYGFQGNLKVHQEWMSSLSRSTPSLLDSQDNISIMAFFMKWTHHQKASFFIAVSLVTLFAFLFLILVFKGKKIQNSVVLDCSMLFVLIPLVSPLGWDYTLLMSILGIMIILNHFFTYSKFWKVLLIINLFVIAFSLFDILGRELYKIFMTWSVITLNFIILTGYLAYLRLRKIC